jgi:hypothetical protein
MASDDTDGEVKLIVCVVGGLLLLVLFLLDINK